MKKNLDIPAHGTDENTALRYLDASRVTSPFGDLASIDIRDSHDHQIGRVSGVLIDPAERRLRFFVVSSRQPSDRSYLLPTDAAARIDPDRKSLQLDIDPDDLTRLPEFRPSVTPDFSDDDLLAAMFARRPA